MTKPTKLTLSIIVLALLANLFLPSIASAQGVTHDPINFVLNQLKWVWDKVQKADAWLSKKKENILFRAVSIAYKNALRTFLSRLAYDTATRLAEGGLGKGPLFNIKSMGDFMKDVGQTTLADTLDVLAKDNGFFNFDVCEPQSLSLKFAIHYSLFGNFNGRGPRGAPRCTLSQISKSWGEWADKMQSLKTEDFLSSLRDSFKPEQNDIGMYLAVESNLRNQVAIKKANEALQSVQDKGFKPITEKISGFIKTPAAVSEEGAKQLQENASVGEEIRTGDIVADSIGIFTNTLASKLLKRLFDKGLVDSEQVRSIGVYNWANRQVARSAAISLASLAQVNPPSSGVERVIDQMSQCPPKVDRFADAPGPLDCVLPSSLVGAIEQGLTVKEAIASGQLNGKSYFGFKPGKGELDYRDYISDFPYRSLVIMRINRIIPSAWELAAQYNIKTKANKTLLDLVDCYGAPVNSDGNAKFAKCYDQNFGNKNPYYHLIDPNWVLKAPESYCQAKGNGWQINSGVLECTEDNVPGTQDPSLPVNQQLVYGPRCKQGESDRVISPDIPVLTVQRSDDYCADRQSCLYENDQGECVGYEGQKYGYCLKEEPIWRFQGQACEAINASCETFNIAGQTASLLKDTLQSCANPGCSWYSTEQNKSLSDNGQQVLDWNFTDKIYLDSDAADCPSDQAGCTNLSRLIQGVNLVYNGDFEETYKTQEEADAPAGWQARGNCALSAVRESFDNSWAMSVTGDNCSAITGGKIPVDERNGLVLGGAFKAQPNSRLTFIVEWWNGAGTSFGTRSTTTVATGDWQWFKQIITEGEVPGAAVYATVNLPPTALYDNIQLALNKSLIIRQNNPQYSFNPQVYKKDYSQNTTYAKQYMKVAPDYLACEGYNQFLFNYPNTAEGAASCFRDSHYWRSDLGICAVSGDAACSNYASFCGAEEAGCQGYKPADGGPEVSARTSAGDVCPASCVGYETYSESPNWFDLLEDADHNVPPSYQNLIPRTAQECKVEEAGCEEFTNLDEVAKGGEGKEFFTQLKQCVPAGTAELTFYYTWEGSDTAGYQLKKWQLLDSNIADYRQEQGIGPCTNTVLGEEGCRDDNNNVAVCTAEDISANYDDNASNDNDCRDYFDNDSRHYLRYQSRTITASSECHPYRRTASGKVYNADPGEGKACTAQVNGCTEYKGNRGNNIRNMVNETFESGPNAVNWLGWNGQAGQNGGLEYSNESLYQGGHSLKLYHQGGRTAYLDLTGQLTTGKEYLVTLWAKKAADLRITGGNAFNEPAMEFTRIGLTGEWQRYELGPITRTEGVNYLKVNFSNVGADNVVYLDNIVLKEYGENFYLIKDSWDTPTECDAPFEGAQVGCQLYADRQGQTGYFKSFDYLCSSAAIGCEAFVNTQNSTKLHEDQSPQGEQRFKDGAVAVPNDGIVYLVNDPSKQCSASYQGCLMLGSPYFDRTVGDGAGDGLEIDNNNDGIPDALTGYNTTAKINNPDNYEASLCDLSQLYCQDFQGELTSGGRYINPLGESGNRTCDWNGSTWVVNNTSTPCPGSTKGNTVLAKPGDNGYEGWAGSCPAAESSCTQFIERVKQDGGAYADGRSYYYLNDDNITNCESEDPEAGCIKFKDALTNSESLIKVKRDRQCSQWLECGTSTEITDSAGQNKNICLDLVKCEKQDSGKICSKALDEVPETFNLAGAASADALKNLSGYSHPGASWGETTGFSGYASLEKMSQAGGQVKVINGGFENHQSVTSADRWLYAYSGRDDIFSSPDCSQELDPDSAFSGNFSLKISYNGAADGGRTCPYRSGSTGASVDNFYPVTPGQQYYLTFYARSSSGQQAMGVGLAWYDQPSNEGLCDLDNNYCGGNGLPLEGPFGHSLYKLSTSTIPISRNWQKYTLAFGPGTPRPFPNAARYFRIFVWGHMEGGLPGSVWLDNFTVEPVLRLNESSAVLSSKECRLYPASDAPACDYSKYQRYEGWKGYCLEPDPAYPGDWSRCLQWFPLDSVQGERASSFSSVGLGYQDRAPLYYCAQSIGAYNNDQQTVQGIPYSGYQFTNSYGINVNMDGGTIRIIPVDYPSLNKNYLLSFLLRAAGQGAEGFPTPQLSAEAFRKLNLTDEIPEYNDEHHPELMAGSLEWGQNSDDTYYMQRYREGGGHDGIAQIEQGNFYEVWRFYTLERMEGCRGHDDAHLDLRIFFDNHSGAMKYLYFRAEDCSGNDNEAGQFWIVWNLGEICDLLVKTVDSSGDEVKDKAWATRIANWSDNTNALGFSKNLSQSPYGSFYQPAGGEPDSWSSHLDQAGKSIKDVPLYVYDGNGFEFGPSAGTPWSFNRGNRGNGADKVCMDSRDDNNDGRGDKDGTKCLTSSEDECGGGVCMGVGKYCYNGAGFMNGQACKDNNDCPEGYSACQTPQGLLSTPEDAIGRIQNLFAKVYGVWRLNLQTGRYEECDGRGNDCRGLSFTSDISKNQISQPQLNALKLNQANLTAPGGYVQLSFGIEGSRDQLPLDEIKIDWRDGSKNILSGPFDYNDYSFSHNYSCTTDNLGRCTACFNDDGSLGAQRLDVQNGSCSYPAPTVNVKDNWGWCAYPGNNEAWVDEGACSGGVPAPTGVIIRRSY